MPDAFDRAVLDAQRIVREAEMVRKLADTSVLGHTGAISSALADPSVRRILDEMEQQRQALQATSFFHTDMMRRAREASAFQKLTDQITSDQALTRAALGPSYDWTRLNALHSPFADAMHNVPFPIADLVHRFSVPTRAELEPLWQTYSALEAVRALPAYHLHNDLIRTAVSSMRTPWMDGQNSLGSVAGLASMQEIGLQLREHAAYDTGVTAFLRSNLGDWRRSLSLPSDIFDDIAVRTALYEERGLNPSLTAFPPDAFREGLSMAGIYDAPPPIIEPYFLHGLAPPEQSEEEIGFQRTNDAHDRLLRFETHIRKFIDDRMTDAFGANWVQHKLPAVMRDRWMEKKQIAQQAGSNHPIIAYADFTDYVQIITQADCWRVAFKSMFVRPEMVKESFQRLYPIRLCTMHARTITQDDELYLYVETKRLLKAIGAEA